MCPVVDSVEQQLHVGFNFPGKRVNLSRSLYDYRHVILQVCALTVCSDFLKSFVQDQPCSWGQRGQAVRALDL